MHRACFILHTPRDRINPLLKRIYTKNKCLKMFLLLVYREFPTNFFIEFFFVTMRVEVILTLSSIGV